MERAFKAKSTVSSQMYVCILRGAILRGAKHRYQFVLHCSGVLVSLLRFSVHGKNVVL